MSGVQIGSCGQVGQGCHVGGKSHCLEMILLDLTHPLTMALRGWSTIFLLKQKSGVKED